MFLSRKREILQYINRRVSDKVAYLHKANGWVEEKEKSEHIAMWQKLGGRLNDLHWKAEIFLTFTM